MRNGDIWTITAVGDDGTITIARDYGTGTTVRDDGTIRFAGVGAVRRQHRPPSLVGLAEHVDLGYASRLRASKASRPTPRMVGRTDLDQRRFYVAMARAGTRTTPT